MSNWNSNFEDHAAWHKLAELDRELARIKPYVSQSTDSISLHTRLLEFAKRIEQLKLGLNPRTTSNAYLNKISSDLEQLVSTLRGKQDAEVGPALNSASSTFNGFQFDTLYYLESDVSKSLATENNVELASNLLQDFKSALTLVENNLSAVTNELGNQQQQIADTKNSISTDLDNFKSAESSNVATAISALQKNADDTLSDIRNKLREAEKLVTIISNHGVIGGYQNAANGEKKAKWLWQGITVLTMIVLIFYATNHLATNTDWQTLIPRALILSSFVALASYAGVQAEKHRKAEQKNRRLELALAAIDPFLANLAPGDRDTLKKELVSSLFEKDTEEEKNGNSITNLNVELLVKLKDLFKQ